MYKTILVPTDGSELSLKTADAAIALAKVLDAKLIAWSGVEIYTLPFAEQVYLDQRLYQEQAERHARDNADAVAERAQAAGVACRALTGSADSAWEGIIDAAEMHDCDLIFMASHGRRGLAALVLGSETQKVLTHTRIPVLVCR